MGNVMPIPKQHRIIKPENRLQSKMRLSKLSVSELMAKANAVMAAIAASYPEWLQKDLEKLIAAHERLREDPLDEAARSELFRTAHDIRGQAAGFGYDLASHAGGSLCQCLRQRPGLSTADLHVVDAHINIIRACLGQSLKGDGGAIGQELVAELNILIERTKPRQ